MIQMKAGTFGLAVNGFVKPMTRDSGPFVASEEQEARLVKLGIAEYVTDGTPIGFDEAPEDMTGEDAPEDEAPEDMTGEDAPEDEAPLKPLEDLTANELREMGKEYGLTFKVGMTKAQMVEAITAAQAPDADEEETDEDAPTFDASEAVL